MSIDIPNPKIVIVLSKNGVESVTVSAPDSFSRNMGYEFCRTIEKEICALNEAAKKQFEQESKPGAVKQ